MIDYKGLSKPFPIHEIGQRPMVVSEESSQAIPANYIDARIVMNRLDEVVGPQNWQKDYKEVKGNLFAGIGIYEEGRWVWKWDVGEESNMSKEKGEASDSFKRAAVNWGIGRFLYEIPDLWVKGSGTKQKFKFDKVALADYQNRLEAWLDKTFNNKKPERSPNAEKQPVNNSGKDIVAEVTNKAKVIKGSELKKATPSERHAQQIEDAVGKDASNPVCPECGGGMNFKNGQYGNFWGCNNYPECKGVRKIKNFLEEKAEEALPF